jgi:guanylate kinase
MAQTSNLIIVSGPSGAGKSALASSVLGMLTNLRFSISYTTRLPRRNERDGVDYHFVTQEQFETLTRCGEWLEWAVVYGNYYGTSRKLVDAMLAQGDDVLLDVDVQGARSIRDMRPDAISIFILPPSYGILRSRLENRKLDKDYVIENRLKIARQEITQYRDYDFLIINEELDRSSEELKAIILGSRCRMMAQAGSAESIIATFGGLNAEGP